MAKGLTHRTVCEDSSLCDVASADYLLMFRKKGKNPIPITHERGLTSYAGAREIPRELLKYKNWSGKQTENRYSHWIWRQYASAFWDDVRIDRIVPYDEDKDDPENARHMHPLQLDVIDRCVELWSNPGEVVCSPFAGVGSEIWGAITNGRKGLGVELKSDYYRQMVKNCRIAVEKFESGAEDETANCLEFMKERPANHEPALVEPDEQPKKRRASKRKKPSGLPDDSEFREE
jgi:DNA modification methylase